MNTISIEYKNSNIVYENIFFSMKKITYFILKTAR